MRCLLTGASGFLGRQLVPGLLAAGHQVVGAARDPAALAACFPQQPGLRCIGADFTLDTHSTLWLPRLQGIDVVINTVGIFAESPGQSFDTIHVDAPCALFAASRQAGVGLVIQVSALGADAGATSRFHLSKKAADDYLCKLGLPCVIVQPSLIFGEGGASAALFALLASLPVLPLPDGGRQLIQPVHIADVCATLIALLAAPPPAACQRLLLPGPRALSLRDYLGVLRLAMGLPRPRTMAMAPALLRLASLASGLVPAGMAGPDALQMLARGNTADAGPVEALLGRPLIAPEQFISPCNRSSLAAQAQLQWLLALLRWSIAVVWIVTGVLSAGLFPPAESYALLARTGIVGPLAPLMLYGAAALDIALGIGTLLLRRRVLWLVQLALIAFYTVLISWKLPEFWLHPYGPILKNLPLLAAIWLLLKMEQAQWTT